jgi:hypothetical protein
MESVEQAREVVSAAEEIVGTHTIHPGFGDEDLDSAAAALSAVRRALNERLNAVDKPNALRARQIAALLVRSEHAQAMVLDAVLARRAAKVATVRDALGRLRQAGSTADLVGSSPGWVTCWGAELGFCGRLVWVY